MASEVVRERVTTPGLASRSATGPRQKGQHSGRLRMPSMRWLAHCGAGNKTCSHKLMEQNSWSCAKTEQRYVPGIWIVVGERRGAGKRAGWVLGPHATQQSVVRKHDSHEQQATCQLRCETCQACPASCLTHSPRCLQKAGAVRVKQPMGAAATRVKYTHQATQPLTAKHSPCLHPEISTTAVASQHTPHAVSHLVGSL